MSGTGPGIITGANPGAAYGGGACYPQMYAALSSPTLPYAFRCEGSGKDTSFPTTYYGGTSDTNVPDLTANMSDSIPAAGPLMNASHVLEAGYENVCLILSWQPAMANVWIQSGASEGQAASGSTVIIDQFANSCQDYFNTVRYTGGYNTANPWPLFVSMHHEGNVSHGYSFAQFMSFHASIFPRFKTACAGYNAHNLSYGTLSGNIVETTSVASGSNGGTLANIASWGPSFGGNGVLAVASTTGFPSSGTLSVTTSGPASALAPVTAIITYAGISGNTFTGCQYLYGGSATGTVTTLASVFLAQPITSIACNALSAAVPAGQFTLVSGTTTDGGGNYTCTQYQAFQTPGAAMGATSITVTSETPIYAFGSGTVVTGPTVPYGCITEGAFNPGGGATQSYYDFTPVPSNTTALSTGVAGLDRMLDWYTIDQYLGNGKSPTALPSTLAPFGTKFIAQLNSGGGLSVAGPDAYPNIGYTEFNVAVGALGVPPLCTDASGQSPTSPNPAKNTDRYNYAVAVWDWANACYYGDVGVDSNFTGYQGSYPGHCQTWFAGNYESRTDSVTCHNSVTVNDASITPYDLKAVVTGTGVPPNTTVVSVNTSAGTFQASNSMPNTVTSITLSFADTLCWDNATQPTYGSDWLTVQDELLAITEDSWTAGLPDTAPLDGAILPFVSTTGEFWALKVTSGNAPGVNSHTLTLTDALYSQPGIVPSDSELSIGFQTSGGGTSGSSTFKPSSFANVTVGCVVQFATVPTSTQYLITDAAAGGLLGVQLYVNASGKPVVVWGNASTTATVTATTALLVNHSYLIVSTWAAAGGIMLYVYDLSGGTYEPYGTGTSLTFGFAPTANFTIGQTSGSDQLVAGLGRIFVANAALTASQVDSLADAGGYNPVPPTGADYDALVETFLDSECVYWPCTDPSGSSSIADANGNVNPLTPLTSVTLGEAKPLVTSDTQTCALFTAASNAVCSTYKPTITGGVSIGAIFQLTSLPVAGTPQHIFGDLASNNGGNITFDNSGQLQCEFANGTTTVNATLGGSVLYSTLDPFLVVATWDIDNTGAIWIYLYNLSTGGFASASNTLSAGGGFAPTASVNIGFSSLTAYLGRVFVLDTCLTPAQVSQFHAAAVAAEDFQASASESCATVDTANAILLNTPMIEAGSAGFTTGAATSTTITTVVIPSGTKVGDIVCIGCAGTAASITWSSGSGATAFTAHSAASGTSGSCQLLTHVYTGTEGWIRGTTAITVTCSGNHTWACDIFSVENATFDPVAAAGQVNAASTTMTVPGVTNVVVGDLLIWFGFETFASAVTPSAEITPPAGFTTLVAEVYTTDSSVANSGVLVATMVDLSSGATGNQNGSLSNSRINGGFLISLAGMAFTAAASESCVTVDTASGTVGGVTVTATPTTGMVPCLPSTVYNGFADIFSLYGTRDCFVAIAWYTSAQHFISSSPGPASFDTSAPTQYTVQATSPGNAAFMALVANIETPSEAHFVERPGITQEFIDPNSGVQLDVTSWGPGGIGLGIGRPVQLNELSFVENEAWAYIDSIVPTVTDEITMDQTIQCADALKLWTNSVVDFTQYPGYVIQQGSAGFGCVLYWRLNDPLGTQVAADFSGNGQVGIINDGTRSGLGVPSILATQVSTAITLFQNQSVNSDPNIGPIMTVGSAQPGAVAFWMQTKGYIVGGGTQPLASLIDPSATLGHGGPQLAINAAGDAVLQWVGVDGGLTNLVTGGVINDGHPHFIVFGFDGTNIRLYIDGVSAGVVAQPTQLSSDPLFAIYGLGRETPGTGVTFSEVAVFDQDLSLTAVTTLYTLGSDTYSDNGSGGFLLTGDSGLMLELLLLSSGVPSSWLNIQTGVSTLQAPQITQGETMLADLISQIQSSELGSLFQETNGTVTFWNRHYAIQAALATISNATFENASTSSYFYKAEGFQPSMDDLDLWNDVPTQINVSNFALAPAPPTTPLYDAQNQSSIRHFGLRSLQGYTGLLYVAGSPDTKALGQFLLAAYSEPYTRVRQINLDSAADGGANLPQMLGRDYLDLITVIYHSQGLATPFDQQAQIEKISHEVTPGPYWKTTWQLAPYVFGSTHWFTWNDATLGVWGGPGSSANNRWSF